VVIVKLQGGLGNQMFQYAAATALLKDGEKVGLNLSFLTENNTDKEDFTSRKFELSIFKNIRAYKAINAQVSLFNNTGLYYKVIRRFMRSSLNYVEQQFTEYIPFDQFNKKKHFYLDGYFQSEKYFAANRQQILNDFEFPPLDEVNQATKNKMLALDNAVSLHIRRGDYAKLQVVTEVHGLLPISYYNKAIEILQKQYPDITLFVFSDDIPWVKENLQTGNIPVNHMQQNSAAGSWKDMALMSNCKHHIIANSSFSWWGAWLSTQTGKTFAPEHWFNPKKIKFNITDFVPSHWEILNYE
jgi:hypothetical protein